MTQKRDCTREEINAIISGDVFFADAADLYEQMPDAFEKERAELLTLLLLIRDQQASGNIDLAQLQRQVNAVLDASKAYLITTGLERITTAKASDYCDGKLRLVLKKEATDDRIKDYFHVDDIPVLPPDVERLDLHWLFSPEDDENDYE